jgi:hypothetical protein
LLPTRTVRLPDSEKNFLTRDPEWIIVYDIVYNIIFNLPVYLVDSWRCILHPRGKLMISIAHPDFQDDLIREAEKLGIWRRSNKIA